MVYKWQGFSYGVEAQIVGEEIEKIEKENGGVTPKDIVNKAKAHDNPMHQMFEWDDKKAAEAHRLDTARRIICCLVTVDDENKRKPTRAYVNITERAPTKQGLFANIKKAMSDAESREIVLKNALNELAAFRSKYQRLSELAEIMKKIDELVDVKEGKP